MSKLLNVYNFLLNNNIDFGTYALVTYNNKTDAIWFTRYNFKGSDWFLESPCQLNKVLKVTEPVSEFYKLILLNICLEDGESEDDHINKFIKPMIIDGWYYEIVNFQCSPFLPKEVDSIELITERECLEYLLNER